MSLISKAFQPDGILAMDRWNLSNLSNDFTNGQGIRLSGSQAKLSYMGHVLMENRNGLLVQTFLTEATGRTERDAAMLTRCTLTEHRPPLQDHAGSAKHAGLSTPSLEANVHQSDEC
jgi:hypothetical protein